MKNKIILIVITIFLFTLNGCDSKELSNGSNDNSKIDVIVTFNPMRELAEYIGGDKVNIEVIVPDGVEAHDFELKAKDIMNISKADMFVYNGFNMEHWVDKLLETIDKDTVIVEASQGVDPIIVSEEEKDNHDNDHKHEGGYDPHTWLGLSTAIVQARNIKDALVKVDGNNKDYYEKNFNEFNKEVNELLNEYKTKFELLENKSFVTGHEAFSYFCRDFGLEQSSVEGVFAEGEPTPKKMKELVDYCKKNGVKAIFVEENISTKVSETLAKEVGASVEVIHTLESRGEKNYIDAMRENLEKVYDNLK
ncbi:metal ABC transporter substrate-binding protein [Clostridium sp. MSJ-11]|uniref:Metal ABC transporter substrate-binding protein n=1 Tax=Clostridium mobile TaxID=2841512 RepID=A0ABS6EKS6_9CLOT|nr:metal ABC transporter substrate-binding protein [Clostridium mobile]MBU5485407.1 metal ABC transporter substrate-binding protein [Clostridium mobile]